MKTAREIIARAYDREQSAQMGEPDPWTDGTNHPEWDDSLACAGEAIAALTAEGWTLTPPGGVSLVEQAFRNGVAYGTVCDVTDVDKAWETSAIRALASRTEREAKT